jgi:hypothetical protein
MKVVKITFIFLIFYLSCQKNTNPLSPPLNDGERITAAYNLSGVESLAKSFSDDLQLLSIQCDNIDYNGYAKKWCYIYSAGGIAVDYYFHSTYYEAEFDSTSTHQYIGRGVIIHPWFNSNVAMGIAEKNGGKDFRIQNPQYTIKASVGEPVIPNSTTYWYITYRSKLDTKKSFVLTINANSGEVIAKDLWN